MSQPDAGRDIISDMRRLNDDMARSIQCGVEQSLTARTRRMMIQNDKSLDIVNRVEQQLQLTNAQVTDMRKEWTKMERRINIDMRELRQEQVLLMETTKDARQDQAQSVKSVVRQEVENMTDTWRRRQDQTLATVLGQVENIRNKVDENMTFTSGKLEEHRQQFMKTVSEVEERTNMMQQKDDKRQDKFEDFMGALGDRLESKLGVGDDSSPYLARRQEPRVHSCSS